MASPPLDAERIFSIQIAGRDDLISMKRASGRSVDLADIAALTAPEHEG